MTATTRKAYIGMGMEGPIARWYEKTTRKDMDEFRKLAARLRDLLPAGGDVLDAIGYQGLFGMEHGKRLSGREGERAVIDAYVALDRSNQRPTPAARAAVRQRSTSASVRSNTSIV